jgi:alkanesulfonate monooxygenase SsuD/methylene tetrahydromethanopterin reductase-like flavin-dependent oxidoreductase (luciferase family)
MSRGATQETTSRVNPLFHNYEESRERFREYLEVMRLAWTQERFSYTGTFYTCQELEVLPKPYQQPYPPLHYAASTRDTCVALGTLGLLLLIDLIDTGTSELSVVIAVYQDAWRTAGHPGQGQVRLRLPLYVAPTMDHAQSDPRTSIMLYYERLRQGYLRSAQGFESAVRTARAAQLATLTYAELLQERVVFGTPRHVTARLRALQQTLGLSGFIIEPNVGGGLPSELVARSMGLFAQEGAPALRDGR